MRISDWSSDVCSSDLVNMGGWYETNDIRREILADLAGKRAYAEIAWLLRYETARYPIRACPVDCRKPVDVVGVVLTEAATGNGQVHPFMVMRKDRKSTRLNSSH